MTHRGRSVRVAPTRGSSDATAGLLAGRPDTSWVASLAGDGGVACFVRSDPPDPGRAGVIEQFRGSSGVARVTAQRLLAPVAGIGGWPGRLEALTPDEIMALSAASSPRCPGRDQPDPRPLPEDDRRLLRLLAVDGRMSFADLARRRVAELITSGVLMFEVEVDPSLYGRRLDVWCWMDVRPSALRRVTGALAGHGEVAFAATTAGITNVVAILEPRRRRPPRPLPHRTSRRAPRRDARRDRPCRTVDQARRTAHPPSMTSMRACLRARSNP
jgi:hypothetical protein